MYIQKEKFNFIFIPFLIIALSVILGYTFVHWLLVIELGMFMVNDDVVNLLIPLFLPWIPLFFWYITRVKYLKFKYNKKRIPKFDLILIAGVVIIACTIISQKYLVSATGKLTELDNISQIDRHQATMYYTLKSASIDKEHLGYCYSRTVSGKHQEDLVFEIYIACPILKNKSSAKYLLLNEYADRFQSIYIDGVLLPNDIRMPYIPKEKIKRITNQVIDGSCSTNSTVAKPNSTCIQTNYEKKMYDRFSFQTDTAKAWLVKKYSDRISNNLPDQEKDHLCELFIK